ncbi:hypothetical protein [Pseudomonas frederiksbergensis]|uniref:hypothetical protein n=1 Tax=Pseudomonas frederiksbergensis TaxID=104087 RepID=UPI003D1B9081
MLFGRTDTPLLHFLKNPMRNIDYLENHCQKPSWKTRWLQHIPWVRNFLTSKQIKGLVAHQLSQHLREIEKSHNSHLYPDPLPPTQENLKRFMSVLSQYFTVDITSSFVRSLPDNLRDKLPSYLENALFTKLEYTCNRITENFELDESYNYSILSYQKLWLAYYMSEIYFFLTQGLMQAKFHRGELLIEPTSALQKSLRSRWLAEVSEFHSVTTDLHFLHEIGSSLARGNTLALDEKEMLTDYVLDKCLSIHVSYLSHKLRNNSRYQYLRDIVFVATYLEMRALHGERKTHYAAFSSYINPASLSLMNSTLTTAHLPKADSAQSFIEVRENYYIRGALNFKYGLKKLTGALLGNEKDPKNPHDVKGLIGKNFEREHMFDYVKNIQGTRFKVHPGLEPGNNAKIKGYDIDLVIEDTTYDTYYFIQAKYRLSDQPTFLSEQYEVMQRNDFHKGYATQLLILKNNIDDESIRKKLDGRGLSEARKNNSHFILLHNLPFLNFHESHGVFFYEWNLFRNLLKNGKVAISNPDNFNEEHMLTDEQLCEPERIVDAYFGKSPSGQHNIFNYALYRNTQAVYQIGRLKFRCDLI